jgi:AraC-like DNA-binding protein
MPLVTTLQSGSISALDYRCTASHRDRPYAEVHSCSSISYVRKGSFGCQVRGRSFELVAGSVLVGHVGDEYLCTHDHHDGGDECLSFHLTPELVEIISGNAAVWQVGSVPPLAELIVFGELAQAAANGHCNLGLDEVGMMLVMRFVDVVARRNRAVVKVSPRDRRHAIEMGLWIEQQARQTINLETMARQAGLSPFHFLRLFSKVLGVTPHQYLMRSRLRYAARLLAEGDRPVTDVALEAGFADLSNFVRTFHRAAGVSPGSFRHASQGNSKILQVQFVRPT